MFIIIPKKLFEINPDYIQIGNEINNGFLFNEGKITNLNQMKELLKSALKRFVKPIYQPK